MALTASTIIEVESGGSDTLNGGAFDPSQTAGMLTNWAVTSANTSAPVVTSVSYAFVAGDAGAWFLLASGTSAIPAWYKIASVNTGTGSATLNAAIGAGVLLNSTTQSVKPTTVLGCCTTGTSLSSQTGSIDYSQQVGAQFTYADLTSTGVGLTATSASHPFGKQQVGNSIVVTGGTNFLTGRFVLASVATVTGTFVGPTNLHNAAGTDTDGAGGMGGAFATPGAAAAILVTSNRVYLQTGTYTVASATINIATGCFAPTAGSVSIEGYSTVRGDLLPNAASGTRPTMIASGISTFTLISMSGGNGTGARNLILDGASLTSARGMNSNGGLAYNVHCQNMTNSAFGPTSIVCVRCSATTCATVAPFTNSGIAYACVAYANTITGFAGPPAIFCLSYGNTGAASDGFALAGQGTTAINCVAYGNGRHGFSLVGNAIQNCVNCIAEGQTVAGAVGFTLTQNGSILQNCAAYNNTLNVSLAGNFEYTLNMIIGTSTFFTNAAGGDFSLNNVSTGGALCRATGYPGTLPVGLSVGYLDIGPIQVQSFILPIGIMGVL